MKSQNSWSQSSTHSREPTNTVSPPTIFIHHMDSKKPAVPSFFKHSSSLGLTSHFPSILHIVLARAEDEGYSHIISWQSHGRSFMVHDRDKLVNEVMPIYFRQTRFASFQRQLNLYGFIRIATKGPDYGGYYHLSFLRSRPDLCENVQRLRTDDPKPKKAAKRNLDFYALPPMPPTKDIDKRQDVLRRGNAGVLVSESNHSSSSATSVAAARLNDSTTVDNNASSSQADNSMWDFGALEPDPLPPPGAHVENRAHMLREAQQSLLSLFSDNLHSQDNSSSSSGKRDSSTIALNDAVLAKRRYTPPNTMSSSFTNPGSNNLMLPYNSANMQRSYSLDDRARSFMSLSQGSSNNNNNNNNNMYSPSAYALAARGANIASTTTYSRINPIQQQSNSQMFTNSTFAMARDAMSMASIPQQPLPQDLPLPIQSLSSMNRSTIDNNEIRPIQFLDPIERRVLRRASSASQISTTNKRGEGGGSNNNNHEYSISSIDIPVPEGIGMAQFLWDVELESLDEDGKKDESIGDDNTSTQSCP